MVQNLTNLFKTRSREMISWHGKGSRTQTGRWSHMEFVEKRREGSK